MVTKQSEVHKGLVASRPSSWTSSTPIVIFRRARALETGGVGAVGESANCHFFYKATGYIYSNEAAPPHYWALVNISWSHSVYTEVA
jgi:hypothetical protein